MSAIRTKSLFGAIVIAAGLSATSSASALTSNDFLGSWCSATARLTFTRDRMTVKLFANGNTLNYKVPGFKFSDNNVTVDWIDSENKDTSSRFAEFSSDRRHMFLQPSEKVPRREYSRC